MVVTLTVVVRATHLPHLPELLLGVHTSSEGVSVLRSGSGLAMVAPAWEATRAPFAEVWCAVEDLVPARPAVIGWLLALCAVVLPVLVATRAPATGAVPRTQPPPVRGARLRAMLQVLRN